MPWWWARRRRLWYGRNRYRRRRWPKRRKRRTYRKQRRYRYAPRRRRRRRKRKVRRKRQTIAVRQWQPDSIVLCKIKGQQTLVLGAEGKQRVCYTNVIDEWTRPTAPAGGGFAVEIFSLGYLYREYTFRRNIWTKTNILKDLVRYLRVKFTFYRHPDTDFVVNYERQLPFKIDEFTYPSAHPSNLLLQKHKVIIPSKFTNPKGKIKHRIVIKPPKQMLTKWFFMDSFSQVPLLMIKAAACNLNYVKLGYASENQILGIYYLNTAFYINNGWGRARLHSEQQYKPYDNIPSEIDVQFYGRTDWKQITINKDHTIGYSDGYFQKDLLLAAKVRKRNDTTTTGAITTPINVTRYNPEKDNGKGNSIYLISILNSTYQKPTNPPYIIFNGLPLWMMLYGWLEYIKTMNHDKGFLDSYILAIESQNSLEPAPQIGTRQYCIPIDKDFIEGKGPYGSPVSLSSKSKWYPNVYSQLKTLNNIVKCGPYIPKYQDNRASTWELRCTYNFQFKWGGPQLTDPAVADPSKAGHYDVPDKISNTIQVRDPSKQKASTLLHSWDYRRGYITHSALKRMSENIETDTTFQPDAEYPPRKKKKITGPALPNPEEEMQEIQSCLQDLCEEDTCQEIPQETNIQQLIQQQREQQRNLKFNILKLLTHLKDRQQMLQLQTGLLE
nr:MAG: ORF1 [Torque teno midi virus]